MVVQPAAEKHEHGPDSESTMSELTTVSGFFVLAILLAYITASAFMFAAWEPDWSFLDAFYFCLITMVRAPLVFPPADDTAISR